MSAPWTLDSILDFLATGRYDPFDPGETVEEKIIEWVKGGGLRSLASSVTGALPADFLTRPWPEAMARALTKAGTDSDMGKATRAWLADKAGVLIGVLVAYLRDKYEMFNRDFPNFWDDLLAITDKTVDFLVTEVSGLTIPNGTVRAALEGTDVQQTRLLLGNIYQKMIDETLLTDDAAEGWLKREPGVAEAANVSRIVGQAFRMQVGDMVAGMVASVLPFGLGGGLTQIAERINGGIALDDAIEEIIQVPMESTITRGLEAYYNRKLKPVDLTGEEARKGLISERISKEDYNKILDNLGERLDIRDFKLDLTGTNLTESDINDAYQRNLLSIEQVDEQYKQKFFQPEDRKVKVDLAKGTRRWQLQTKVVELLGNLYRDGVKTQADCKPYLNHLGFEEDEQELWFLQQDLERQQRKWITDFNLIKLVEAGHFSLDQAVAYEVVQGMEVNDAIALMGLAFKEIKEKQVADIHKEAKAAIAKLPAAVKDQCDDLLSPEHILSELLTKLIALIPSLPSGLSGLADTRKIIECALKALGIPIP